MPHVGRETRGRSRADAPRITASRVQVDGYFLPAKRFNPPKSKLFAQYVVTFWAWEERFGADEYRW
jgi:hypothetical protein